MARNTLVFGTLLIVVGLAGYFGTGMASVTALIPAFIGLSLALLGLMARKDKMRMHAIHGAVLIGSIGFIGGAVMLIIRLSKLLSGGEVSSAALVTMALMTILCAAFVALCVRSFIDARRDRERKAGTPGA